MKRISTAIVCAIFFCSTAFASDAADLTVAQIKASPPVGQTVRVLGIVVGTYICPPCPMGAECKPCMSDSSVSIADAPGAPQIAIAAPHPEQFERGAQYRFEFIVSDGRDGVDGHLLRSQRPVQRSVWSAP
jgi:hypothetical protein